MALLATKAFGEIEVNPAALIQFPEGLFGFHEHREFALLDEQKDDSPFAWLQSTADSSLAFIIIEPDLIIKDGYVPDVSKGDLEALGVSAVADCKIFLIVTIPADHPEEMTANLQGPVLIHRDGKVGRQVISNNNSHLVRVSIMEMLEG